MRLLTLGVALLLAIALASGHRGRGHHGRHLTCSNGCKPTCTDGAQPLCADGTTPTERLVGGRGGQGGPLDHPGWSSRGRGGRGGRGRFGRSPRDSSEESSEEDSEQSSEEDNGRGNGRGNVNGNDYDYGNRLRRGGGRGRFGRSPRGCADGSR